MNEFLEQSRAAIQFRGTYFPAPSAKFLPFRDHGRLLQWMATSWYGLNDGELFVIDCKGERVAALHVGEFEQLRSGPTLAGFGKTIEVIDAPGEATGEQWHNVELLAFFKESILTLWTHEADDEASFPEFKAEYTDTFRWQYIAGGTVIHIVGERAVGDFRDRQHGWAAHTTHSLGREAFCWRSRTKSFVACAT